MSEKQVLNNCRETEIMQIQNLNQPKTSSKGCFKSLCLKTVVKVKSSKLSYRKLGLKACRLQWEWGGHLSIQLFIVMNKEHLTSPGSLINQGQCSSLRVVLSVTNLHKQNLQYDNNMKWDV